MSHHIRLEQWKKTPNHILRNLSLKEKIQNNQIKLNSLNKKFKKVSNLKYLTEFNKLQDQNLKIPNFPMLSQDTNKLDQSITDTNSMQINTFTKRWKKKCQDGRLKRNYMRCIRTKKYKETGKDLYKINIGLYKTRNNGLLQRNFNNSNNKKSLVLHLRLKSSMMVNQAQYCSQIPTRWLLKILLISINVKKKNSKKNYKQTKSAIS